MNHKLFNQTLSDAVQLPAAERHQKFLQVHRQVWESYRAAINAITAEQAAKTSSDGRSIAQVVGHIAEWDRFFIQVCSEFLMGLPRPRAWSLKGYIEQNGNCKDFDNIEEFNQYQMQRQADLPWEDIQQTALRSGEVLFTLFTTPGLMDAAQLEKSKPCNWQIPGFVGEVPMAWLVWAVIMEHEGVEHTLDLGIID